jgi:hypothetical protein
MSTSRYWRVVFWLTRVTPPTRGPSSVEYHANRAIAEARIAYAFAMIAIIAALISIASALAS